MRGLPPNRPMTQRVLTNTLCEPYSQVSKLYEELNLDSVCSHGSMWGARAMIGLPLNRPMYQSVLTNTLWEPYSQVSNSTKSSISTTFTSPHSE